MAFRSVHHILGSLEKQERWQGQRQFQQLVNSWVQIVGAAVSAQTRPLGIQRQVLYVATSNSVWAQNLAFERQRILTKLNAQLSLDLTDVRFSPAQWQTDLLGTVEPDAQSKLWQRHPSRVQLDAASQARPTPADTPEQAFQNWAVRVQQRSQHLPLCPACRSPTPIGELERWQVCSLCVVKRW